MEIAFPVATSRELIIKFQQDIYASLLPMVRITKTSSAKTSLTSTTTTTMKIPSMQANFKDAKVKGCYGGLLQAFSWIGKYKDTHKCCMACICRP